MALHKHFFFNVCFKKCYLLLSGSLVCFSSFQQHRLNSPCFPTQDNTTQSLFFLNFHWRLKFFISASSAFNQSTFVHSCFFFLVLKNLSTDLWFSSCDGTRGFPGSSLLLDHTLSPEEINFETLNFGKLSFNASYTGNLSCKSHCFSAGNKLGPTV